MQSIITFRNSQGDNVRGTLMKLTRRSIVLEVYNPYSIVQLSEILSDLLIYRDNRPIYKGRAVVSNLVNTGLMLIISATLIDSWNDFTDAFSEVAGIQTEVDKFVEYWKSSRNLHRGYQLAVNDIRSFLVELSRWLEQVDIVVEENSEKSRVKQEAFEQLNASINPHMQKLYQRFEAEAANIDIDTLATHKNFVQQELHPLTLQAPYVHRIFSKPLGYAGDFEMMNMIQRNPADGPTTYAKLINYFFTRIPIALSVINRTQSLIDHLTQIALTASSQGRNIKTLSIGCGPAIEIQRFIREKEISENGEFHLLDFNELTLEYAHRMALEASETAGRKVHILTIHDSVNSLLKKSFTSKNQADMGYDFIYCAGLFDYLSDKVCKRLTQLFYYWIKPGGKVLVTNMHPDNNFRYCMEHVIEWHLIYRNEEQMKKIAPEGVNYAISKDATGVNISLEAMKPEN